jgi:hypothetical protein
MISTSDAAGSQRQQYAQRNHPLLQEPQTSMTSASVRWIKIGVVALPLYGAILGFTTRKPQPDQVVDPEGWARFVSSPSYLVEHISSSVVGAVLAIFGTLALGAFLAHSRAPRRALWGIVLAVAGQALFMVPGTISTFATPAIGAAYLSGNHEVMAVEFSPVLTLITGVALSLTVAGNIFLGLSIWRSGVLSKRAGLLWIIGTLVFYVFGAFLGMTTTGASLPTQPVGAVLMATGSGWIAWALLRPGAARGAIGANRPSDQISHSSSRA